MKEHNYLIRIAWTGNQGEGTKTYNSYLRNHEITAVGKPVLLASSDPVFRGDPARYNPEELLVATLSSCHMLGYLHLCAVNGISVVNYQDEARGVMQENRDGSGAFQSVTLHPKVTITAESDAGLALRLHHEAHRLCFIANSVNFPVHHVPEILHGLMR
ncbi:MAG: OsmC family protein [Acidobacteriota bacterium]|nr:OsmC family protein [Acidobacteriota bacterium]